MRTSGTALTYTLLALGFALQLALPFDAGYTDRALLPHLLFAFFHANVFHLAANLFTASLLPYDLRDLLLAYLISLAASFVAVAPLPTMGFSGILYVLIGMRTTLFRGRFTVGKGYFVAFLLAGLVLPRVNGLLHILCFIGGILVRFIRNTAHDYAKAGR